MVKRFLTKKEIPFEELDVSIEENKQLAKQLKVFSMGTVIDENNNILDVSKL